MKFGKGLSCNITFLFDPEFYGFGLLVEYMIKCLDIYVFTSILLSADISDYSFRGYIFGIDKAAEIQAALAKKSKGVGALHEISIVQRDAAGRLMEDLARRIVDDVLALRL